jgi:hypothetical protein
MYCPDISLMGLRKTMENNQKSQSVGWDLSPGPSENEEECYPFVHNVWYTSISDFIINSMCHIIQVTLGHKTASSMNTMFF